MRWAAHSAWISLPGNAPHLLGVLAEERVVEAAAEPARDPVLERLRRLGATHLRCHVGAEATDRLDDAEAADDILGAERVGEVVAAVVDAREPRAEQELVAERLLPHLLHPGHLGEEPVPAEVEAEAVVLHGLRDPAHLGIGLEHDARTAA